MHDAELALAFALDRSPGSYAVLVGAGMSRGAGLPTAWDVQLDLISEIRMIEGDTDPAVEDVAWFERKFGQEPGYDRLLGLVARTPAERQAVLRRYFEPENISESAGAAHHALARLVARGSVRVVLTLNFDHLIEDALRREGIEPTIVSTPEQFAAATPLHAQRAMVVHLHGDYTNPASLLNTTTELQQYDLRVQQLVGQIAREYGLVIVGWSAEWDVALRQILAEKANPHFSTWWYDPAMLTGPGQQLAHDRPAVHLPETADVALPRLLDAVTSTHDVRRQLPTRPQIAAAGIRRRLTVDPHSSDVEDEIAGLFDQLQHHPVLVSQDFSPPEPGVFNDRKTRLEASSAVLMAAVAALARTGTDETEAWWFDGLAGLTFDRLSGGLDALIRLQNYPATLLWYSAGIAAVSAKRLDRVRRMLRDLTLLDREGHRRLAPDIIGADQTLPWNNPSRYLFDTLQPTFLGGLGMTRSTWEHAWEQFEYITLLEQTARGLSRADQDALAPLVREAWVEQPEGTRFRAPSTVPAERELHDVLRHYRAHALLGAPHLRTLGMAADFQPRVSSAIRYDLTHTERHSLVDVGLFTSPDQLRVAVAVLDQGLAALAHDAAYRSTEGPSGGWVRNTGFWIDDPAAD